ncbi:MAG: MotA/TolQ/ExbB proton channel family protein [Kiritimatiellia bacterium]
MSDILKWFTEGGPVMWPILGLSVVGLAIVAERVLAFRAFAREAGPFDDPQTRLNALQRGFGLLSTIITAEPMLGILGTVTGIIKTFGAFRLAENASPLAATAGIGEALITTAAGIVAALILLFPYNLLLGLLAKAAARLERESADENPGRGA